MDYKNVRPDYVDEI
ncbi:MAG TPA: hypothetical protein EYG72_00550 [Candidatus Pacebacteria bacterium]|nr:hypothetical protein [Candidatus Paceibacterota bacterium]